jgi:acetyltransferase-like isoleucine patch superfamily enzyme
MSVIKGVMRGIIQLLANVCPSDSLRSSLYRIYGINIGDDVFIGAECMFDRLHPESIEIGDRTAIGFRTMITAHQNIPTGTVLRRLYPNAVFPTVIENDVWIMPGVIIVPGVRVGHHSVIATGVVVHKDVPPYSVVVGPGFRIAKELPPSELGEEAAPAEVR